MKCDIIDIHPDDFFGSIQPGTSEIVSSKEEEKRNENFPLYSDDKKKMGTFVMQYPRRFYNLWVLKPIKELNYVDRFNNGERHFVFQNDLIIDSPWDLNSGHRMPTRDYSWLLEVLQGNEKKESLFGNLVTNSQENDELSACTLIDKIIADGDIKLNEFWRVAIDLQSYVLSKNDMVVWFSFLKSQFPPILVGERQMPNVYLPKRKGRDENDYKRTMETLGVYNSEIDKQGNKVKSEIWLCPKRIKECAESMGISYVNLFVIVYLHELAHAAFDPTIHAYENKLDEVTKEYKIGYEGEVFPLTNPSSFTMEESLANAMMLKYLDWYAEVEPEYYSLFEDAKRFVNSQTTEYKFGWNQFEADVDFLKWREYKLKEKKLEEWYDHCFGRSDYSKEMFNNVFF